MASETGGLSQIKTSCFVLEKGIKSPKNSHFFYKSLPPNATVTMWNRYEHYYLVPTEDS